VTDAEIRDVLAEVARHLYRMCPTMDLLADVRDARAALDLRLAEVELWRDLEAPEVYQLFCGEDC